MKPRPCFDAPSSELRELARCLRESAERTAVEVGASVRDAFLRDVVAEPKTGHHDLVTDEDRRAEAEIRARLVRDFPHSTVVGEEAGGVVGGADVVWYVDPIDGTNNFAAGIPFFCLSIGAVLGDRVLAGVVYDPVRGELFAADLDGAWCNGERLAATRACEDATAVLATEFPGPLDGEADALRFGGLVRSFRTVRRLGSGALTLAYVAAGRVDVTFGTRAHAWDVTAGLLLVRAAGGAFVGLPEQAAVRPWEAPTYLAHAQGFDLRRSCLATLAS